MKNWKVYAGKSEYVNKYWNIYIKAYVCVKQVTGVVYRSTNTRHVCTYSRGPQIFQKNLEPPQNSGRQKGDMNQVTCQGCTLLGAAIEKQGAKEFCFPGVVCAFL